MRNKDNKPSLLITVPCFNEELTLKNSIPIFIDEIENLIAKGFINSSNSGICFIDDGSSDRSWDIIKKYSFKNPLVKGIKLTRNKGHQAALFAGLMHSKDFSDITISIDADLQDDISVIKEMIKLYNSGFDIVYGVRSDRSSDSFSKRITASIFYKLMKILGTEIISGHADFRLISSRALYKLSEYKETSLFLRGIIPLIGYKSAKVYYPRLKRNYGKSKYTFKKSLSLAIDGILSLSFKPIRYISYIAIFSSLFALIPLTTAIIQFALGGVVKGWTSIIVLISVFGSLQLISLGLIGEYLGRIYNEVKSRPKFHIQEYTGFDKS